MKKCKRMLAVVLCVLMLVSIVPMSDLKATAASSITVNGKEGSITISGVESEYLNKVYSFLTDSRWKHETAWSTRSPKLSSWSCSACCAYAADFAKFVYGVDNPNGLTQHYDINSIKTGDILWRVEPTHYIVVLQRNGNQLITAEANVGSYGNVRVSNSTYEIRSGNLYQFGSFYSSYVRVGHYKDWNDYSEPLEAPTNVLVGREGNDVGVSWNAVNGATSYDVYLIQAPFEWDDIKYHISVSADYRYARFDDVEYGDYYAFVIARPSDNPIQSEWKPISITPLSAPQNLVAVAKENKVAASWDPVQYATSYDIYLIQAPYTWNDVKYQQKCSSDFRYVEFDNVAYGKYRLFVVARPNDSAIQSEWKEITVGKLPEPTNVKAYSQGQKVYVSWSNVSGATSYDIYLRQSPWGVNDTKYKKTSATNSVVFDKVNSGYYCAYVIARPSSYDDTSVQSEWVGVSVFDSFTITFNANGGSCSIVNKIVEYNSTYGTLPTATRTGYTFDGWYTSATGGSKVTADTKVTITSNQTLYAHWTQNHTHSYTSTVTKAATCKETGVKTFTCSCGSSYTETIAKNASNHVGGTTLKNAKTATCTATGYTGDTYCNGCNTKLSAGKTIEKIAHTDKNSDGYCDSCNYELTPHNPTNPTDPTPNTPETKPCTCKCHSSGFTLFIWKIGNFFHRIFGMKQYKTCACNKAHW